MLDENNPLHIERASSLVVAACQQAFPKGIGDAMIGVLTVENLSPLKMSAALELVLENLEHHYVHANGPDWRAEKTDEMKESGLVYVTYFLGDTLGAFVSCKLVVENHRVVLYLYEIHLAKHMQGLGHGSRLMASFHAAARSLSSTEFGCTGTNLTVFSANARARDWYFHLGYDYTEDSPRDKKLRGRIIRPDIYLLQRNIGKAESHS